MLNLIYTRPLFQALTIVYGLYELTRGPDVIRYQPHVKKLVADHFEDAVHAGDPRTGRHARAIRSALLIVGVEVGLGQFAAGVIHIG